jgi:hypothetical protein
MPKRGRVYINQSISFPPGLLAKAKERARRLGLPFSAYVQKCLELDLQDRKALVFAERHEPMVEAAEEAGPVANSPRGKRARR